MNLVSQLKDRFRVVSSYSVQDVQRINSNLRSRVAQTNESIVEEDIEPLLIELLFTVDQVGMAGVDNLLTWNILLQRFNNFDSHLKIMMAMRIDQFTHILSFLWRFSNDRAVVLEQVSHEKLVELFLELDQSSMCEIWWLVDIEFRIDLASKDSS